MKQLITISLIFACFCASSQTFFVGDQDSEWNQSDNWDNGLPGPGNDAIIPAEKSVLVSDFMLTVNFGIVNNGKITFPNTTEINNTIINNGNIVLGTSSFVMMNGGAVFLNNGDLHVGSSLMYYEGSFFSNSTGANMFVAIDGGINGSGVFVNDGTIVNYGSIVTQNPGYNRNGGTIYNLGSFGNWAGGVSISFWQNDGVFHNLGDFSTLYTVYNNGAFYNCGGTFSQGAWVCDGCGSNGVDCPTCFSNPMIQSGCPQLNFGCLDLTACNYSGSATVNDGSCEFDSCAGCTDPIACNFEPEATIDDGSCADLGPCGQCGGNGIPGCNDPLACNFSPEVDCSDGSCVYEGCVPGCTNEAACNYLPSALVDDGTCILPGCNDVISCNYDPNASCYDDNSCLPEGHCNCPTSDTIEGCRMPSACNYNASANSGDADLCSWSCYSLCAQTSACNYQEPITSGNAQLQCSLAGGYWNGMSCNYNINSAMECQEAMGWWDGESCHLFNDPWSLGNILMQEAEANEVSIPSNWDYSESEYWGMVLPFGGCNDQGYYGSCLCANEAAANLNYSSFDMQTCSDGSASWTGHGTGSNTVTINYPCTPVGYYDGGTGSNNITIYIPSGVEQFHLHNSTGSNVYNVFYNSATTVFTHYFSTGSPTLNLNGEYVSEPFCSGCMMEDACNYQSIATSQDEESCDFTTCAGCLDENACNYDAEATYAGYCIETGQDVQFDFMGMGSGTITISAVNFLLSHDASSFTTCLEPNTLYSFTTESHQWSELTYSISGVHMVQGTRIGSVGATGQFIVVSPGECNDCNACNYSSDSNSSDDCDYTTCNVIGCMDSSACNFLPGAIYDADNCIDEGLCYDSEACNYFHANDTTPECREFTVKLIMSSNDGPISFNLMDGMGEIVEDLDGNLIQDSFCGDSYIQSNGYIACSGASSYIQGNNPTFHACLTEGECYVVEMYAEQDGLCNDGGCTNPSSYDAWGLSGHSSGGPHVQIIDLENTEPEIVQNFTFYEGLFGTEDFCVSPFTYDIGCGDADFFCSYPGCMDPEACNFDNSAGCDDESCTYDCIWGCTNNQACNFLDTANADDGTCYFPDVCGVCEGPGDIYNCGCFEMPNGDCDCDGNQLDALGICGGNCIDDADMDGICDDVDDCVGEFDECGICNGLGAIYDCGCSDIPADDCDCDGNQLDVVGVCGGNCFIDADADGICDDVDTCLGVIDACGICNGPGTIYECGCTNILPGDCDCDGNQHDALGVCGGDCSADLDSDGICDEADDCVGTYDDCGICNGPGEIFDCGCNHIPSGDCNCEGNQLDALGICGGSCAADVDSDGICDEADDCVGTYDDCGICNGPGEIFDCGCNQIPSGDCNCEGNQLDALGICGGSCAEDADGDGICDHATNIECVEWEYTYGDGECNSWEMIVVGYECVAYEDIYINGECNGWEQVWGVVDVECTEWIDVFGMDVCVTEEPVYGWITGDCNSWEQIFIGTECVGEIPMYETGECNGWEQIVIDQTCIEYSEVAGDECVGAYDECGVCNGNASCYGCTYSTAMNYDSSITIDDGSCIFEDCDLEAAYAAGVDSVECPECDPNAGYEDGYSDGVESVDITSDNQMAYDQGYAAGVGSVECEECPECDPNAGYEDGYSDGVESVDITSDNQMAYDQGYAAGVDSVECPGGDNSCPGDLDGNGSISTSDLLIFLSAFGDTCE